MAYELAGHEPRISSLSLGTVKLLSLFSPLMRELKEMHFLWDRPYVVDHSKYAEEFGDEHTPLEEGLAATLSWYREQT